jgi:hypothetical protein
MLNISTLKEKMTILAQTIKDQLPTNVASYPERDVHGTGESHFLTSHNA